MLARTLAALVLAATLATVPGVAEAGPIRDELQNIKQRVKLDIRAAKCLLKRGPCGF
jgi:hypothetical protein